MEERGELAEIPEEPAAPIGLPLAAAAAGAAAGAIGWALMMKGAGYEIGWIAWGIGGLIGWLAVKVGGRGQTLAIAAAVLTVVSIFGGKMLGYYLQVGASGEEMADQEVQAYDEYMRDAADWAALCASGEPEKELVREYMLTHDYADPSAGPVGDELLDDFLSYMAPRLERMQSAKPSREEFHASSASDFQQMVYAEASLPELVIDDLNHFDALFVFLGVSTAFSLVMRAKAGPGRNSSKAEPAS